MAAKLQRVDKFVGSKPECLFCGQNPRDDDGNFIGGVTAPGVDINWGDNAYVCGPCVLIAGELFGMMSPEDTETLQNRVKFLEKRVKQVVTENDELREREKRMLDGARAKKEAKKAQEASNE